VDQKQIIKLIDQMPEAMKTEFISTADQLWQKGREEGLEIMEHNKLRARGYRMARQALCRKG